jgi:hypothetical protein
MGLDRQLVAQFREELQRARERDSESWALSTRLVGRDHLDSTIQQLVQAIQSSSQPAPLQSALLACFPQADISHGERYSGEQLKELTGLPPHKAVRALCVLFQVGKRSDPPGSISSLSPLQIEMGIRTGANPYDLLLSADVASLLDLGAGDLSFATELADQYVPKLSAPGQPLILHCIDRLNPSSKLGSVLHTDPNRWRTLHQSSASLQFRFWGDQDMFSLDKTKGLWPRYTIVTCHAPATPTFAFEPSRLSKQVIEDRLRATKGDYRTVRTDGEEALEVLHGGKALLFPAWKFEIHGPLALLHLMARRGKLCVLSAVDTEVFWELLAQLVADERFRPRDVVFTPSTLPEVFGPLYHELSATPVGGRLDLSTVTDLRPDLPPILDQPASPEHSYRFRYVELRRGGAFDGIPASRTARLFKNMTEEAPPWLLTLIPDS